jgi:6-phosphofructokinase 1
MRRIGILTAGGDTPAVNATLFGAVERANARRVEVDGIRDGFVGLLDPRLPHVRLNPLFATIPELDPCRGGTLLGSSRAYLGPENREEVERIVDRLNRLRIEGLICVGGDGTTNALQCLAERFPCVVASKTIDNDLGLNYVNEPNDWSRTTGPGPVEYRKTWSRTEIALDEIINYVTPGFATAVFVVAQGVQRIRTTAEGHRRIAIIEVMGRQTGHIALASAYGQPDLILIPEVPLDLPFLDQRIRELYRRQKHVVIVIGEALVDAGGKRLAAASDADPAGNVALSGAAESLKRLLVESLGDDLFQPIAHTKAQSAIFTRKVGHTQRGGRPILFDRFYATQLGGHAVELLLEGRQLAMATLQWSAAEGFRVDSFATNMLRDQSGVIHPRLVHPAFYDSQRLWPSTLGVEYLLPIFSNALGSGDLECTRESLFRPCNLTRPYHSINVDIDKRTRWLADEVDQET